MRIVRGVLMIVIGGVTLIQPGRAGRWARNYYVFIHRVLPFMTPMEPDAEEDDDKFANLPYIVLGAFMVFVGVGTLTYANQ
jgi:hypothetical protein